MDSRVAVLIIISVSLSALLSRFSLLLSLLLIMTSFVLFFPSIRGSSIAVSSLKILNTWIASTPNVQCTIGISQSSGLPLLVNGVKKGYCVRINTGEFHTLPTDRLLEYTRIITDAFALIDYPYTIVAVPMSLRPGEYHVSEKDASSHNYNKMLDYVLERQYYYQSYIIIWEKSGSVTQEPETGLSDKVESLTMALSGVCEDCEIVRSREIIEKICNALKGE